MLPMVSYVFSQSGILVTSVRLNVRLLGSGIKSMLVINMHRSLVHDALIKGMLIEVWFMFCIVIYLTSRSSNVGTSSDRSKKSLGASDKSASSVRCIRRAACNYGYTVSRGLKGTLPFLLTIFEYTRDDHSVDGCWVIVDSSKAVEAAEWIGFSRIQGYWFVHNAKYISANRILSLPSDDLPIFVKNVCASVLGKNVPYWRST